MLRKAQETIREANMEKILRETIRETIRDSGFWVRQCFDCHGSRYYRHQTLPPCKSPTLPTDAPTQQNTVRRHIS